MDILVPRIYHGYTSIDIPCISMDIRGIYMMDIHGYPCIYHVYPPRWIYMVYISMDILVHLGYPRDIDQDGIYMGYTWNIPCIYMKSGFQMRPGLSESPVRVARLSESHAARVACPTRIRLPDSDWPVRVACLSRLSESPVRVARPSRLFESLCVRRARANSS
jgi:hypothetical protein